MTQDAVLKSLDAKFRELLINNDHSVREAMRRMSQIGQRILFVVDDEDKLLGSLTDGDIRKWVLAEGNLQTDVSSVYNTDPITLNEDYKIDSVKDMMLEQKIEGVPVLNHRRQIKDVLLWMKVFGKETRLPAEKIDLPVVIMAGGKGTRLDPFTKILPKPLIPVGDKTILETILEKFIRYGIKTFYLSINHKSRMIKAYFEEIKKPYEIRYIEEMKPLGTAGSLRYLVGQIEKDLIVSNCDIIIEGDYAEIVKFHQTQNYDITIVGSFRHFSIPYGVCHIQTGGDLIDIEEKPEFDFLVNTGMYVMKSEVLIDIPENEFYNMTDLIQKVRDRGGRVGVYPIDEKSWIDVGQWDEYHRAIQALQIKE